jgi:exodeoxyribonuclease VII small subunit
MTFEESMKKLEQMSEKIRDERTSLDEAVKCYEEGIKCYKACEEILNSAKQKIEIYSE